MWPIASGGVRRSLFCLVLGTSRLVGWKAMESHLVDSVFPSRWSCSLEDCPSHGDTWDDPPQKKQCIYPRFFAEKVWTKNPIPTQKTVVDFPVTSPWCHGERARCSSTLPVWRWHRSVLRRTVFWGSFVMFIWSQTTATRAIPRYMIWYDMLWYDLIMIMNDTRVIWETLWYLVPWYVFFHWDGDFKVT